MRLPRASRLPDLVTVALLIQGLGFGLFSQRDMISAWLSVYLANVAFVAAIALVYLGVEHRRGAEGSTLLAAVLPGAIALLFPLIGLTDDAIVQRVIVAALVSCAGYAAIILVALFALEPGRRAGPLLVVLGLAPVLCAQVLRATSMIGQGTGNLFAPQIPQITYAAVILVGMVCTIVGYLLMLKPAQASPPTGG